MAEKQTKPAVNTPEFYVSLIFLFLVLLVLNWAFPNVLPFEVFEFFKWEFSWGTFLKTPWMLLLFGPVLALIGAASTRYSPIQRYKILREAGDDFWTSVKAGIFEEISFRWLLFFYMIFIFTGYEHLHDWLSTISLMTAFMSWPWWAILLAVIFLNFAAAICFAIAKDKDVGCTISLIFLVWGILFVLVNGAITVMITKWLYIEALIPFTNWITAGWLSTQLTEYGWIVAAAIISSNWRFGSGHIYQGCVGFVNSWVLGMLFFFIMFNFGLPLAILLHALYDIVLTFIQYTDALLESV